MRKVWLKSPVDVRPTARRATGGRSKWAMMSASSDEAGTDGLYISPGRRRQARGEVNLAPGAIAGVSGALSSHALGKRHRVQPRSGRSGKDTLISRIWQARRANRARRAAPPTPLCRDDPRLSRPVTKPCTVAASRWRRSTRFCTVEQYPLVCCPLLSPSFATHYTYTRFCRPTLAEPAFYFLGCSLNA